MPPQRGTLSSDPAYSESGLTSWARATGRGRRAELCQGGLRFAFYGRVSTEEHQDPVTNGKPAYRCRHGHASSARPDSARPKNTCVREDQILPHLSAMAILLAGNSHDIRPARRGEQRITPPGDTASLIDELRERGLTLTYDPQHRTLRADTQDPVAITIGR